MPPSSLSARFHAIDQLLYAQQGLWRTAPFKHRILPWEAEQPDLAHWLRGMESAEIQRLQSDPQALLDALVARLPALAPLRTLTTLPRLPTQDLPPAPSRLEQDIPGRKWHQIEAFAACLPAIEGELLDWCAGKGHLGRLLSATMQRPVHCLEWDETLCESGRKLSQRFSLPVHHTPCDVMQADAARHITAHTHAVALHACGGLHRRLIDLVSHHQAAALSLSPCCYHLEPEGPYAPLSGTAAGALTRLEREDIRLCVQETVTGGQRVARLRDQGKAWRLGFDLLQRDLRGTNEYLPTPSAPAAWLRTDFRHYCEQLAALKALRLPATWDVAHYEQAGWARQREVAALELLRHAFRRPLELWLALDRALALEEAGFEVSLGEFCERRLTPRNIMIHAHRTG